MNIQLNTNQLVALHAAIKTALLVRMDTFVIGEGKVRGLNDKQNAVILSELQGFPSDISLGLNGLQLLDKKLKNFDGCSVTIDANEPNEKNPGVYIAKKIIIKSMTGNSKFEHQCASERLIRYPKSNNTEPDAVLTFSRAEVEQLSRGIKLQNAEILTLQVKRTGEVKIECRSGAGDIFEINFEKPAEFINDAASHVAAYDFKNGVFLEVLENMSPKATEVQVILMQNDNIEADIQTGVTDITHKVYLLPRALTGD